MRKVGKRGKKWQATRKEWLRQNPPGFHDEYTCGICYKWVHKDDMVLDHKLPRSSYPERAFDLDNLQPAHRLCNNRKGSKHQKETRIENSQWNHQG